MATLWSLFDSAAGDMLSPPVISARHRRIYRVAYAESGCDLTAELLHHDMIRLTVQGDGRLQTSTQLLRANDDQNPFWKFALVGEKVVLQTELTVGAFDHVRDVLSYLDTPPQVTQVRPPENTDAAQGDVLRVRRMILSLESDLQQSLRSAKESFTLEGRHAGMKAALPVTCRSLPSLQCLEMRGKISTDKAASEPARHFLLSQCRSLACCRAALNAGGFPFLIAFVPFPVIENGTVARWYALFLEGLFRLQHTVNLNDQKVSHIYHQLHMKGYIYGDHAQCNQSANL